MSVRSIMAVSIMAVSLVPRLVLFTTPCLSHAQIAYSIVQILRAICAGDESKVYSLDYT